MTTNLIVTDDYNSTKESNMTIYILKIHAGHYASHHTWKAIENGLFCYHDWERTGMKKKVITLTVDFGDCICITNGVTLVGYLWLM